MAAGRRSNFARDARRRSRLSREPPDVADQIQSKGTFNRGSLHPLARRFSSPVSVNWCRSGWHRTNYSNLPLYKRANTPLGRHPSRYRSGWRKTNCSSLLWYRPPNTPAGRHLLWYRSGWHRTNCSNLPWYRPPNTRDFQHHRRRNRDDPSTRNQQVA